MRPLVIGAGSMGRRRMRILTSLGVQPLVYDIAFDDMPPPVLDQLFASTDTVFVCTPPASHGEYIRRAVAEGKHLFVEHGVSDDGYAEAIADRSGLVRAPSCTFRFNAPVESLRSMVMDGVIGRLLAFQHHMGQYLPDWHPWADYRGEYFAQRDTSAIFEMLPFELCWLNWVVGREPVEIAGAFAHVSDLEMAADDVLAAAVRYPNAMGSVLLDVLSRRYVRRLVLIGEHGSIEWDAANRSLRVEHAITGSRTVTNFDGGAPAPGYVNPEAMYEKETAAFVAAVRGEAEWPYTFEEDRRNLDLLRSLQQREMVNA